MIFPSQIIAAKTRLWHTRKHTHACTHRTSNWDHSIEKLPVVLQHSVLTSQTFWWEIEKSEPHCSSGEKHVGNIYTYTVNNSRPELILQRQRKHVKMICCEVPNNSASKSFWCKALPLGGYFTSVLPNCKQPHMMQRHYFNNF